ncbi:Ankyrin repeat domain-containing protein, chloroplastic [Apostasia shenzhenica]|uniref:Ankyrin repeat domain-containing protein, chloroplastic n=1 Tax=Apostasia shenzhenica TaxID=1088818 RepID=A0A2I0BBS3_9ASPA|nr:Ankyrin repeat domain-containing protein, chloroplastic [Apostasia shenzhenica]
MDDTGAIHFASQKGHLDVVRILLSTGVSVKASNRKGMTPLHFAVQGSHQDLVKYLIRKGANLNAKNKSGETPIDLAKTDELKSLILHCEKSCKSNEHLKLEPCKAGESKSLDVEDLRGEVCGDEDDREKRKKDEDEAEDSLPDAKKARVSLAHLLAEDDTVQEED